MQGLALVTGRRIVGVSALEALAQLAGASLAPGARVASWIDAQRGEVFSAFSAPSRAALSPSFLKFSPPAATSVISHVCPGRTGTEGATLRVYLERFEPDPARHGEAADTVLAPLAAAAAALADVPGILGRSQPSVVA